MAKRALGGRRLCPRGPGSLDQAERLEGVHGLFKRNASVQLGLTNARQAHDVTVDLLIKFGLDGDTEATR